MALQSSNIASIQIYNIIKQIDAALTIGLLEIDKKKILVH